jgi:hypothetical protein
MGEGIGGEGFCQDIRQSSLVPTEDEIPDPQKLELKASIGEDPLVG